MIDLHTHTILSDGVLLPSELARRAEVIGYEAIGITDHCDQSNIDFVIPRIVKASESLSRQWKIKVIPGVELTHLPLEEIAPLVRFARANGAKLVLGHGETLSEPVIKGTNRRAIEAGVDILAHPGNISEEDAGLAYERKVFLEITARKTHSAANKHVAKMARATGAKLVLNTDAHRPEDLIMEKTGRKILAQAGLSKSEIIEVFKNSKEFVENLDKS